MIITHDTPAARRLHVLFEAVFYVVGFLRAAVKIAVFTGLSAVSVWVLWQVIRLGFVVGYFLWEVL